MKSKNLESRIKLPDFEPTLDIDSILESSEINYSDKIEKPIPIIEIAEPDGASNFKLIPLGTYGNFSAVVGKQKSRKTFFMSMLMASAIKDGYMQSLISNCAGKTNIFFDTEQARYHVAMVNRRIIRLANFNANRDDLKTFSLRKYNPTERTEIIDYTLRKTPNLGFIVIDGIRDLVTDINDADQATDITTRLMQWTEELNCHICVGLHLNKGINAELRGHLGTEVQNKAESIIEVEKHEDSKYHSIVKARDFRGIEFETTAFRIDQNDYLPYFDNEFVTKLEYEGRL